MPWNKATSRLLTSEKKALRGLTAGPIGVVPLKVKNAVNNEGLYSLANQIVTERLPKNHYGHLSEK